MKKKLKVRDMIVDLTKKCISALAIRVCNSQ